MCTAVKLRMFGVVTMCGACVIVCCQLSCVTALGTHWVVRPVAKSQDRVGGRL